MTLGLGDIDAFERRLRATLAAIAKRRVLGVTLIEAVDEAELWPSSFEAQQPFIDGRPCSAMLDRAPLLMCAIAAEIGYRFEGVGTDFWKKLGQALGAPITMAERSHFAAAFATLATRHGLSQPSDSAFSAHFSIISWPIANALLPLDLVGPVVRLLARAPVGALPGPGRTADFASLRAWASAAEGARLVDWLRFEAASERVLAALLSENRGGSVFPASYARLQDAILSSADAFQSLRASRLRARQAKAAAPPRIFGRLTLTHAPGGLMLYVTWPPLPREVVDDAKEVARAAGWRPRLWSAGARLHCDAALGDGPFALAHAAVPHADEPAYDAAADVFGADGSIAAALAGRRVDWTETLLFDPDGDRARGEQRFEPFDATSSAAWIATRADRDGFTRLRSLGLVAGYRVHEADLANAGDRAVLAKEGLLGAQDRVVVARHPTDAIAAPCHVVRPGRPYVGFTPGPPLSVGVPQVLPPVDRVTAPIGQIRLRSEAAPEPDPTPVSLSLAERDTAFSALVERRLEVRIHSTQALRDVPVVVELEVGGKLVVRTVHRIAEAPTTISGHADLFAGLYAEDVRGLLLRAGAGVLRVSIGRLASIEAPLARPAGAVDWTGGAPTLLDGMAMAELVCAAAVAPHRFAAAKAVVPPDRGAQGFALRFADGRIADPMNLLAAPQINLGDLAASFGDDLGSRRLHDGFRGNGDLARARVAWSRASCTTLQALAAKARVVRQFEEPLIFNLCGRNWFERERADRAAPTDPYEALYFVALDRGLASLPPDGEAGRLVPRFAAAFAERARRFDPDWLLGGGVPLDGAMDDALNFGFADAVDEFQRNGELLDVDPDDVDFGNPQEVWAAAADEALRHVRRARLAGLIAPSEGGRRLRDRSYAGIGIAELGEDLAAWTRRFALPRGYLSPEAATAALQLWLAPAACDALDAAMHVQANDPFVARAVRYAALRAKAASGDTAS